MNKKTINRRKDTRTNAAANIKANDIKETVSEVFDKAKEIGDKTVSEVIKATNEVAQKIVKEEVKPEVFLQVSGQEAVLSSIIAKAKEEYAAKESEEIRSMQVYLKPEENAAYCVINDKPQEKIQLF